MEKTYFIVIFFIALVGFSCRDKDEPCLTCPPPYVQTIFLDTTYVEPTEIGVRVQVTDSSGTSTIQLFRDTIEIFSKRVLATDTTIIDDSLLPARIYRYKAYRLTNGQRVDSSNVLTVRTMDTTSHNFTWEIDTLGDGANSVLYDVAIVNDTLAYAVGEIYKRDSTGQFEYPPYGLAIWNGKNWTLKKLYYRISSGDTIVLSNIRGMLYFSPSEIWFTAGSIFRWDGISSVTQLSLSRLDLPDPHATIEKIWGTSSSNLYGVGNAGTIVHYENGTTWRQLESGTDVSLLDVWGSPDGSTVWTCGYYSDRLGTFLLRYQGIRWELAYDGTRAEFQIRSDSLSGAYTSVYTSTARSIYLGSSAGVYHTPTTTRGEGKRLSFTPDYFPGFPRRLRGNADNDLILVGDYTMIAHFNGMTWRYFNEFRQSDMHFNSVAQKGDFVVAVGIITDPIHRKGIVFRGTR